MTAERVKLREVSFHLIGERSDAKTEKKKRRKKKKRKITMRQTKPINKVIR